MGGILAKTSLVTASLAAAGCAPDPEVLPPRGEALVVVDTDAPVPRLAGRLRVDLYDDDGTWLDSRDIPRENANEWPASFSVYTDDEKHKKTVIVRLRAYPEGKIRDYRGERFSPRPVGAAPSDVVALPPPAAGEAPRLVQDGIDVTPDVEPQPGLAIDRLLRLRLVPGVRGSARVVLRGACTGTMADLLGRSTCVDTEGELSPISTAKLGKDMTTPPSSERVGTFGATETCTAAPRPPGQAADGTPLHDDEVCVPGGLLVLGSGEIIGEGAGDSVPERIAVLPPLLVDRYEVTVARWRQALAEGLRVPIDWTPIENENPLATDSAGLDFQLCTYSAGSLGREEHALSCVPWDGARAFCRFYGGDLPTEAEWEHVAAIHGRPSETRYPWGQEKPTCDGWVFGRFDEPLSASTECFDLGLPFGPQPLLASEPADATPGPDPVVGLGGGVTEWVLDDFRTYDTACWALSGIHDPRCVDPEAEHKSNRGAGWTGFGSHMLAAKRQRNEPTTLTADLGFRCVRPGVTTP